MTDKYLFSQGNISFENGDYTRAISFYSNAIDLNPDDLNYYSSRCISYLKNNEIEQAINDANILISKNPNIDASYILLGISFLAYNQVEKAEDAFVRARTINPQNPIANQYLEEIQQSRQNGFCPLQSYAGNLQPIMQRYQEDPSSINDFSGNSSILDTLNSYLDRFDRPSTIHYHNYNNTTKYQNNDFLFSSLTDAKTMFSKGNYKEAINISQQALNNCNSNTPSSIVSSLFQIVSSSYMKIKDMRNAIGYSEYFLQLAAEKRIEVPKSVKQNCEYIQILSHHFTDRINSESGVANYRASKSDEPMPLFFQTEILKHIKNKRYEKAVELSNQATSLFPNDASILSISSKAKQKVDDLKGAIEDGKKALSINSSLSKVSLLVAKCYIKMNELHQAKKFVRMALASDVQNNKAVELQRLVQDLIHQQKEQEKVTNIQPAEIQNEESEEQKGGKFEGGDRLITPSDKPNSNPHSHRMQMIDGRRKKGPLFTMKNRSNSANDAEIDNTKPNSQPPDRRNYAAKLTYCSDNEDAAVMKPSSQTASYPRIQFKLGDSRTTSAKSTDNRNNDIEIDHKYGYKANLNSSQNNVYPTSQPPITTLKMDSNHWQRTKKVNQSHSQFQNTTVTLTHTSTSAKQRHHLRWPDRMLAKVKITVLINSITDSPLKSTKTASLRPATSTQ